MSSRSRRALSATLLVAVGLVLYGPAFAVRPFHGEESRRAIPAREMLASGDWTLPTIWGHPYLSKPPGHFWIVAATAQLTGAVDETSTRLPSILSTVATALLVFALATALYGEGPALAAGLLFLLGLNVLGKAPVGEIEPPFALCVLASIAALWAGRGGDLRALFAAGIALGAALLLKGPAALLFYAGGVLGIAAGGGGRAFLRSSRPWLPLAVGLAPVALWAFALLSRPEVDGALSTWFDELARTGPNARPGHYATDRLAIIANSFGALIPASLLCALAVGTQTGRRLWREPGTKLALWSVGVPAVYFFLAPGSRPRYLYPATPMLCLVAGAVAHAALREGDHALRRRLGALAAAALVAAVLAGVAGFVLLFRPVAGLDSLGAAGILVLTGLVAAGLFGLQGLRTGRPTRAAACVLAALALLRLFRLAEIVPQQLAPRETVAQMSALERSLPPDAVIGVHVTGMWNQLVYLPQPLRWIGSPSDVTPGAYLLLDAPARTRFGNALVLEDLHSEPIRGRRTLSSVRVAR